MFEIFKYNIFSSSVLMQIFPYSMTLDLPVTHLVWAGARFLMLSFWFLVSVFLFLVSVFSLLVPGSGFWFQFSDASSLTYVFIFHISKNYPTSGIWSLNSNFSFRKIRVQFLRCLVFWLLKFTNKFDLQAYCFSFWE